MGKVQILLFDGKTQSGKVVDSTIHYAESLANHRLDRRRNYRISSGIVYQQETFSSNCPNCVYEESDCSAGCSECGYTKRRKYTHYLPITSMMDQLPSPF